MAPAIIEKEIIQSCQSASNACQRLPRLVKYYNGTKFEVTIDVGMCSGQCHGNTICQSFDKKTKSISTANGDRCLDIIVDCACVEPSCYRMSYYEGFPEQYTDSHGNTALQTKIIDVGKCIGSSRCLKKLPTGLRQKELGTMLWVRADRGASLNAPRRIPLSLLVVKTSASGPWKRAIVFHEGPSNPAIIRSPVENNFKRLLDVLHTYNYRF